jgi:hypothetical protein
MNYQSLRNEFLKSISRLGTFNEILYGDTKTLSPSYVHTKLCECTAELSVAMGLNELMANCLPTSVSSYFDRQSVMFDKKFLADMMKDVKKKMKAVVPDEGVPNEMHPFSVVEQYMKRLTKEA